MKLINQTPPPVLLRFQSGGVKAGRVGVFEEEVCMGKPSAAYSEEEKREIIAKVKAAKRSGTPVSQALKELKLNPPTYYGWLKTKVGKRAMKTKTSRKAKFVDIPAPQESQSGKVAVIICESGNLKSVLSEMGLS